jgi:hypothetical protein
MELRFTFERFWVVCDYRYCPVVHPHGEGKEGPLDGRDQLASGAMLDELLADYAQPTREDALAGIT